MIPFPAPMGWRPTTTHVPDVVTFVGDCPVDPAHPAEWTEHREDTRLRASHYCPVCEVGAHRLAPATHPTYPDIVPGQSAGDVLTSGQAASVPRPGDAPERPAVPGGASLKAQEFVRRRNAHSGSQNVAEGDAA